MEHTRIYFILILMMVTFSCSGDRDTRDNEEASPEPVRTFILDADTGNEMDDLYAIVRCLLDDEVNLAGLTSAHFNNVQLLTDSLWHIYPTDHIHTVGISQELNESILDRMDRNDIPHPEGCDRMVGYAWGYYEGAPVPGSPAVDFIESMARRHDSIRKLNVLTLGPVTNIASLLLKQPGLAKNIRLFALNMKRTESGAWDKNSFNARNDINGLDILLSMPDLEMVVMPGNVARTLTFSREETLDRLSRWDHPVSELLAERWDEVSAGDSWIMWDLALVEAVIHPGFSRMERVSVPPENGDHEIWVYTDIDAGRMRDAFWKQVEGFR